MSSKKPYHRYQELELLVQDMASEGKGISKVDTEQGAFVVFIPNVIPGQKVRVKLIKVKARYAEAKLLAVLERSPSEIENPYFEIPGAPYIKLPVQEQHAFKQKNTLELFKRIGKYPEAESLFDTFISSPRDFHYRNKMEYSFSAVVYNSERDEEYEGFALGFKRRGQWLSVEALKGDSGLFDAELENALPQISSWFEERGLSAWHPKQHRGFCRFLTVKKSFVDDQLLINFVSTTPKKGQFDAGAFADFMQSLFGHRLAGLVHTINDDQGDRPLTTDGNQQVLFGANQIREQVLGLDFKISLESFFQTNPASAERLYSKALDYVFEDKIPADSVVLDLFSGTGTITQLLAKRAPENRIIGVELIKEAVEDARVNASANGLGDLEFYANDVGKFLLDHPDLSGAIHTLVMDPPRAGIAPKTLRKVMRLEAQRIVYISCNPATQARDMAQLAEVGYKLKKFSLVDQFPHTAHVESVALFERLS